MKNLTIKKKIILWFALILLLIVFISEGITISITNQVLNKDAQERFMIQVSSLNFMKMAIRMATGPEHFEIIS